jgi:hypothetical protein
MGLLWQALLGTGTSTLVSGSTYQQVFTLGDNPSSLTLQKGVVEIDPRPASRPSTPTRTSAAWSTRGSSTSPTTTSPR